MKKKIFLATHNEGKIERFRNLLRHAGLDAETYCRPILACTILILKRAEKRSPRTRDIKARAYCRKCRFADSRERYRFLGCGRGTRESSRREKRSGGSRKQLSKKEIAAALVEFWQGIARKHGGKVDAAWVEAFVLLSPDGKIRRAELKREVILTDQEFGTAHIQMPVRLSISPRLRINRRSSILPRTEIMELKPITDALTKLLEEERG